MQSKQRNTFLFSQFAILLEHSGLAVGDKIGYSQRAKEKIPSEGVSEDSADSSDNVFENWRRNSSARGLIVCARETSAARKIEWACLGTDSYSIA
jgi:hypothetical protein